MSNPMVNYSDLIKETTSNSFNVHDRYKNNTVEQNVTICKKDSYPFSVGVINVTGDLNIGMMMRSACLMGAENFYIFGRKKFDRRSTVGAENYINIIHYTYDDPQKLDDQLRHDIFNIEHTVVVCEQNGTELGSDNEIPNGLWWRISQLDWSPLFLFGSESHGIPNCIGDATWVYKASIPQRGVLRSFNVAAAMNIICWDYIKEMCL